MTARLARPALLLTLALFAGPATAVEFRAGDTLVIGADEVIADDLYVTGGTVTVEGRVEGDLIAAAREIRMNGEVTGDLIAAGQAVVVDGDVGDDVRMAGMGLQLGSDAAVADDVIAAGFSLEGRPGSFIGGSLLYSGFQALLAGAIAESLMGSTSHLEIRGRIGGDSEVTVEGRPGAPTFARYLPSPLQLPAVPGGLTLAESARIDGKLVYISSHEARGRGAGSGAVSRIEPQPKPAATETPEAADASAVTRRPAWQGRLLRWAGLILLGLLLAWWIPGWLEARSGDLESKALPIAGIGFLGLAALPVAVALALVIVIAVAMLFGLVKLGSLAALAVVLGLVGLGLIALLFWLTAAYLAPVLVGLCTGRWVLRRFAPERSTGLAWPLVAGLLLLLILRFLPYLGFLVALVVLLLGWGAILLWLWRRLRPATPA